MVVVIYLLVSYLYMFGFTRPEQGQKNKSWEKALFWLAPFTFPITLGMGMRIVLSDLF